MLPFLESIRLENGRLPLLKYHQKRLNRTFSAFFPSEKPFDLSSILRQSALPGQGVFKLRFLYGQDHFHLDAPQAYTPRPVRSLQVVEAPPELDYTFKRTDRSRLDACFARRGHADDVLITQNGLLTDTYYANILLWQNGNAYTPVRPLLRGTCRAYLLELGKVQEREIHIKDLPDYQKVTLINAMLLPGSVELPVRAVFF